MYVGQKTKKVTAMMYTTVFCLRRLFLVCTLLVLYDERNEPGMGIWLILAYNGLQSLYLWYMALVVPHEEPIHNRLEYFNELCLIMTQYTLVFFLVGNGISMEV